MEDLRNNGQKGRFVIGKDMYHEIKERRNFMYICMFKLNVYIALNH